MTMLGIETAALSLAKIVAARVGSRWLGHKRERDGTARDLSDVVALHVRDRFLRRKIELQLQTMAADVAERIERSFEAECAALLVTESTAALEVVAGTFGPGTLTDEALFAADG